MKKKLGIVTLTKRAGIEYKKTLQSLFGNQIDIITFTFGEADTNKLQDLYAVLTTTTSQYEALKKYIDMKVKVIVPKLTISLESYNKLKALDTTEAKMLVSVSLEMCLETMTLFYQLGLVDLKLVPVYPSLEEIPHLDCAITPDQMQLVPATVKSTIDIGNRLLSKTTIVGISVSLGLEEELSKNHIKEYFSKLVPFNEGVEYLMTESNQVKNRFNALLLLMEKGVLGINNNYTIETCNGIAINTIGLPENIIGQNAKKTLPQLPFEEIIQTGKTINQSIVEINNKVIVFSIYPITNNTSDVTSVEGAYCIFQSFESQENEQNLLRLKLVNKGHIAKYSVHNIIGNSSKISKIRETIVRMGNSHSSVLITGESGTGKELVAQAIHNASPIRNNQFVAINCAAISPQLLESELFGYDSGAFTGALKSGKIGIFELAHKGTLFLDEIGELPISLQARLLRVIQEKEVMRVGGNKIIKIDVRIVAATNKDLYSRVQNGDFREDLYYRLNVLPIHIPPLRERRSDIKLFIEYFKNIKKCSFELSKEVECFLYNHDWHGNIRELENAVEYFDNIEPRLLTLSDLPHHMKNRRLASLTDNKSILNNKSAYVLKLFYNAYKYNKKLGRRSICTLAYNNNIHITEHEARVVITNLKKQGYLYCEPGHSTNSITSKGIELIE
jgi:transcriptional regulator with PAS, ATPase and Fis domain